MSPIHRHSQYPSAKPLPPPILWLTPYECSLLQQKERTPVNRAYTRIIRSRCVGKGKKQKQKNMLPCHFLENKRVASKSQHHML